MVGMWLVESFSIEMRTQSKKKKFLLGVNRIPELKAVLIHKPDDYT